MVDWSTSATGGPVSPALNITTPGSRMLYWAGVTALDTLIRVKRSVDSGVTFQTIGEFYAVDQAGMPAFAFEIFDTGDYRVYTVSNGAETEIVSKWFTDILPVPDSELQRITRRVLGATRLEVACTNREIRGAYQDALLQVVNTDLSAKYGIIAVVDEASGRSMAVGISSTMSAPEQLLLGYAAAIMIVEGWLVDRSRTAISMDSPTGRVNTTISPAALKDALDMLQASYDTRLERIRVSTGMSATSSFMDTTNILLQRGYDADTV